MTGTQNAQQNAQRTPQQEQRTAGARRPFDLRHAIAALFGVYGAALVLLGAGGASPGELRKTGGWNVNLWCGVAMLAFAALCAGWARWRPLSDARPARPEEPPADTSPPPVPRP